MIVKRYRMYSEFVVTLIRVRACGCDDKAESSIPICHTREIKRTSNEVCPCLCRDSDVTGPYGSSCF